MLIESITRKSSFAATLLLITIVVAEMLRGHLSPYSVEVADSPYRHTVAATIIAVILLIVSSIILGKLYLRSGLHKGFNTLPIPIFGVIACGIFVAPNILNGVVVALLLTLSSLLMAHSLSVAGEKNTVFFASILLGICPLIYPPSILFVALIPIAAILFSLTLRQLFIMVVGYILPMGATSYAMWYRGDSIIQFGENLYEALLRNNTFSLDAIPYIGIAIVAIILIAFAWGLFYAIAKGDNIFQQNRSRCSLRFFSFELIIALSMLALPSADLTILPIIAVPMTILLCFSLSILPSVISTILYWILLLFTALHLFVM